MAFLAPWGLSRWAMAVPGLLSNIFTCTHTHTHTHTLMCIYYAYTRAAAMTLVQSNNPLVCVHRRAKIHEHTHADLEDVAIGTEEIEDVVAVELALGQAVDHEH